LKRTVGLLANPGVVIVQTPQFYYNGDPIQHNLLATQSMVDDQRFFFDISVAALIGDLESCGIDLRRAGLIVCFGDAWFCSAAIAVPARRRPANCLSRQLSPFMARI
jgi:hypothetical protein